MRGTAFFLGGFTAGEGSFSITTRGESFKDGRARKRFVFTVSAATRDREVLESLHLLLGCGAISDYRPRRSGWEAMSRFDIWAEKDHIRATIPFFDEFLLRSKKRIQYERWRDALFEYRRLRPPRQRSVCSEPGYEGLVRGRGLCRSHYYRATGH